LWGEQVLGGLEIAPNPEANMVWGKNTDLKTILVEE